MTDQPDILALDLATVTGFARGRLGQKPVSGSIRFGRPKDSSQAVFGAALVWLEAQMLEPKPDIVIIERLLPPEAMKNKTSRAVRDRLAGLHGIARAAAHLHGIEEVTEASVGDVRRHFIGDGSLKRKPAKQVVIDRCVALGWQVEDDNAADACALWSYACGVLDPKHALMMTPLFGRARRVSIWP